MYPSIPLARTLEMYRHYNKLEYKMFMRIWYQLYLYRNDNNEDGGCGLQYSSYSPVDNIKNYKNT